MRDRTSICAILGAVLLVAIALPALATSADRACSRDNPSAVIPPSLIEIQISRGETISAATLPQSATVSDCALARWNEPAESLPRALVLVENLSIDKVFARADITVRTAADAQLVSRQFSINRGETAFYLFVGVPRSIKIAGLYDDQFVSSRTVAIPKDCKPMPPRRLRSALADMVAGGELADRLQGVGLSKQVLVVRIGLHDSSVASGNVTGAQAIIDLSTDRSQPAHIECF